MTGSRLHRYELAEAGFIARGVLPKTHTTEAMLCLAPVLKEQIERRSQVPANSRFGGDFLTPVLCCNSWLTAVWKQYSVQFSYSSPLIAFSLLTGRGLELRQWNMEFIR